GRSCRSDVCDDKDKQTCYKHGSKPTCVCDKGYEFDAATKKCIDIDECKDKRCPALANCTNTVGSFQCDCPRGQKHSDKDCVVDTGCAREGYCRGDPN
ncbi:hypothetical protein PENTCL1PPCAC_15431, partial [Pristionchus entomophagus]